MEGPLCYWGSDWWKGTGDSSSLAHGQCSMRPPELNTRSSPPGLSERLERSSCAGGTRRFMHAPGRCHGSKAHRRCASYLAEKLEPSGVIRLTIGRAAARSSGWLEFFSKI